MVEVRSSRPKRSERETQTTSRIRATSVSHFIYRETGNGETGNNNNETLVKREPHGETGPYRECVLSNG